MVSCLGVSGYSLGSPKSPLYPQTHDLPPSLSHLGVLTCRVLYDMEMENISKRFNPEKPEDQDLIAESIHLLNLFTFHPTTPAGRVRTYIEESFFAASKDTTLPLLTTKGVKPSNYIRIANTSDVPFLINTPLLPDAIATAARTFIDRLVDAEILKKASWEDVKSELSGRTLSTEHAVQFLRWLAKEGLPPNKQMELISMAVVVLGDEKAGKILNLGAISSFVVPGHIPSQGGLPPYVLPLELGKTFSSRELASLYRPLNRSYLTAVGGKN